MTSAKEAGAQAGKIRRKSKDLEASLDLMAASDAWNALGAAYIYTPRGSL